MKILIYDDNTDYLWLFEKWFVAKKPEHQLICCKSEEDLFQCSKILSPDVIFVDVFLPERNGFQMVKSLRKLKALALTRIYLLTAIGGEVNLDLKKAQVDGFITKTIGFKYLVRVIEEGSHENFKFPESKFQKREEDRYDRYTRHGGADAR